MKATISLSIPKLPLRSSDELNKKAAAQKCGSFFSVAEIRMEYGQMVLLQ